MNEALIAFKGEVELLNASWDLENGRMVEFRICGEAYGRIHPFKKYQQRRNGRVGSRFEAAFARSSTGELLMQCSLMLAAWKDSSSIGQSVKFWLDDEVEMHPFCGCQRRKATQPGDVFALILVELADDDTPVHQPNEPRQGPAPTADASVNGQPAGSEQSPRAQPSAPKKGAGGGGRPKKFSSSVHLLVTSARFVQWLQETKGTLVKHWTPELARQYTKKVIQVESLGDLDRDQVAVKRFNELIRRPYARWHSQEP